MWCKDGKQCGSELCGQDQKCESESVWSASRSRCVCDATERRGLPSHFDSSLIDGNEDKIGLGYKRFGVEATKWFA